MKNYSELLSEWEDEMRETEIGAEIFYEIKDWYDGWGDDIPPGFLGLSPSEACEEISCENLERSDAEKFAKLKVKAEEQEQFIELKSALSANIAMETDDADEKPISSLKDLFLKYGYDVWERELCSTESGQNAYNALLVWVEEAA